LQAPPAALGADAAEVHVSRVGISKDGGLVGQVLKVQSSDLLAKVMLAEGIIRAYAEVNIPALHLSGLGEMHGKCL
jgi:hypothetical protein